jgi:hypothetical protein
MVERVVVVEVRTGVSASFAALVGMEQPKVKSCSLAGSGSAYFGVRCVVVGSGRCLDFIDSG